MARAKSKSKFIPILISGHIGSGKSTLAKALAKKYRAHYLSGSQMHRALMKERMHAPFKGAKKIEQGFWESKLGEKGMQMRQKDLSIDKEMDRRMLAALKKNPHSVSDSRLAPWLYKGKAIRIWLSASETQRAKRVGARDQLPAKKIISSIRARNNSDKKIYLKLYGIRMGKDFGPFDLIIKNDNFSEEETLETAKKYVDTRLRAGHRITLKKQPGNR